ncbi:glycerate 2-kinase [Longilinea arvoryzae]|uniref:Glycerate 2-kinase n=1 Tax=Longilinea arvoryzae TaxID=360412 RepID=A0A0S7BCS4_9CHLR|nr:glycerate kinase [Longilinea arvoryzae]GAP12484.1 glycerate 2-kinase [Longilinea arvoryzae]
MNPDRFDTHTLRTLPWGNDVRLVLAAALDAVDPQQAVLRALQNDPQISASLSGYRRVLAVGAGKAAYPMALALEQALGDRLERGLVVTKDGHIPTPNALRRIRAVEAGHPLPDERGAQAARQIADLLNGAGLHDLAFCLISGGGSALLTAPAPEIPLADLQQLTTLLLRSGAPIQRINGLRKHLEILKGGGLARLAAPARVITLILSDVVGDPLDAIASGPTVPDSTTYAGAWHTLEEFGLLASAPPSILARLRHGLEGRIPETLKPGDPVFARVSCLLVGSNALAADAAAREARSLGWNTAVLTTQKEGEARTVGAELAELARQVLREGLPVPAPACLILGGETTVTVRGSGRGGRNQEAALGAVAGLAGLPGVLVVSLATDGGDGPTDAAGAVASGETQARAAALGLDPEEALLDNDAYPLFDALGDLLKPGPTRTNVNDLMFVFVRK